MMPPTPYPPPRSDRSDRAPLFAAMLVPVALGVAMLPSFFHPAGDRGIAGDGPGLWTLVAGLPGIDRVPLAGLAMASAIGTAAAILAHAATFAPRGERRWAIALLAALAVPALLPAAGLASFAPALPIAIADAWHRREATALRWTVAGWIAAAIGWPAAGAVAILIAIRHAGRVAIVLPANDNASPLRPQRHYPPLPLA